MPTTRSMTAYAWPLDSTYGHHFRVCTVQYSFRRTLKGDRDNRQPPDEERLRWYRQR